MTTVGIAGLDIEAQSDAASSVFWRSLGFEPAFETDHGSAVAAPVGRTVRVRRGAGGTGAPDAPGPARRRFGGVRSDPTPRFARSFERQHWGVVEAIFVGPDGRAVSVQALLPATIDSPDADSPRREVRLEMMLPVL